jgi:hypothetical protein
MLSARRSVVVSVALGALFTACGSSTSSSQASGGTQNPGSATSAASTGKTVTLPDPCKLLTATELTPLNAESTGAQGPGSTKATDPQYTNCHWKLTTADALEIEGVNVLISTPSGEGNIDYYGLLAGTFVNESSTTSVPVGTDGKLIQRYFTTGGGGVGKTILFHSGKLTVVVSESGESVDAAALQRAAKHVAYAL